MNNNIIPKLTLVGAGPGDADLITIKGVKAIADADVILYDALINTELLNYARRDAQKIFVGKKAGNHSHTQDQINELIVYFARNYGHVVRLKGGDPFVFGRGYEELIYAEKFDIKVDIIPGISSSIAVPEIQKIPLTKRGVSESFWVTTGTTSNGKLSDEIIKAAESNSTVVILMGLRKLQEISSIFIEAGKGEIPAAVIQSGSLPEEKILISGVKDLATKNNELNLSSPAIIVIGEVVALHPDARKFLGREEVVKVQE